MPGRQVGLGQELPQQQRGQRGRRGRLEHDRRADRDRRGDLVRHQVEREVERADAEHRPLRHRVDQRQPAGRGRVGVEALEVAGEPAGLLGRPAERRHRPADLAAGPLQRLAVLAGDQPGDLLGPLASSRRLTWSSAAAGRWRAAAAASWRPAAAAATASSTCAGVALAVCRPRGRRTGGDHDDVVAGRRPCRRCRTGSRPSAYAVAGRSRRGNSCPGLCAAESVAGWWLTERSKEWT